jgi:AcrR family transcriptional regulator
LSPRSYNLGQRKTAIDETRQRILTAARDLLTAPPGFTVFTVEAVARRAGVARMTIYYQFRSKHGLLEAVYDDIAARGGLAELLPRAFHRSDPVDALRDFIRAFVQFWASDTLLIRRLRSLAALDPDFEPAVQRDDWRRAGLTAILGRLSETHGRPQPVAFDERVDVLCALTGFEFFDAVATNRSADEVAQLVEQAALLLLDLNKRAEA